MPGEHLPPNEGRGDATLGPVTAQATGTISLSEAADQAGVGFRERIALQDAALRRWMARFVIPAFIKANILTLIALGVLVVVDEVNIVMHLIAPGDRIIGGQVIMAEACDTGTGQR